MIVYDWYFFACSCSWYFLGVIPSAKKTIIVPNTNPKILATVNVSELMNIS